jgi:hypothetical protein
MVLNACVDEKKVLRRHGEPAWFWCASIGANPQRRFRPAERYQVRQPPSLAIDFCEFVILYIVIIQNDNPGTDGNDFPAVFI